MADNDSIKSGTVLTPVDYQPPFTNAETVVLGVVIWILLIFGVSFNVLTMLVIKSSRELRTEFMRIIFFLCISDLISAIISPFVWYRDTLGYDNYSISHGFCNLTWGVDIMTSQATALLILFLTIIRYIAIQFPLKYRNITYFHTMSTIAVIWLISIGFGLIPMTIYLKVIPKNRTDIESPASKWPACSVDVQKLMSFATFIKYATPIFFYLPIFLVIAFSLLIGVTIFINRKGVTKNGDGSVKKNPERTKRQIYVAKQLSLIIFSFLVGYIPFTAYSFWTINSSNSDVRLDSWFATGTYLCTRISECLNPVFYNAGSAKMRKHTLKYIKRVIPCCFAFSKKASPTNASWTNANSTKVTRLPTTGMDRNTTEAKLKTFNTHM